MVLDFKNSVQCFVEQWYFNSHSSFGPMTSFIILLMYAAATTITTTTKMSTTSADKKLQHQVSVKEKKVSILLEMNVLLEFLGILSSTMQDITFLKFEML